MNSTVWLWFYDRKYICYLLLFLSVESDFSAKILKLEIQIREIATCSETFHKKLDFMTKVVRRMFARPSGCTVTFPQVSWYLSKPPRLINDYQHHAINPEPIHQRSINSYIQGASLVWQSTMSLLFKKINIKHLWKVQF